MSDLDADLTTRSGPERALSFIDGLEDLARNYDVVLCDVWGVLHDGLVGFAGAHDALVRFRAGGGSVILVSNAPRPGHVVATQLKAFGVGPTAVDAIVTSGDLTRTAVLERSGQTLFHLGPDRDLSIYDDSGAVFAPVGEADYVVCTGLVDDDTETVADYLPVLSEMRGRDLWMLCANPDLVVERGARLLFCAGALAAAYEDLGGRTFYPGKPHRPVYERALAVAGDLRGAAIDVTRVLAIGDAIRTDIAGARAFGIDALMVGRGIHAGELGLVDGRFDRDKVAAWLAGQPARPTAFIADLSWSPHPTGLS